MIHNVHDTYYCIIIILSQCHCWSIDRWYLLTDIVDYSLLSIYYSYYSHYPVVPDIVGNVIDDDILRYSVVIDWRGNVSHWYLFYLLFDLHVIFVWLLTGVHVYLIFVLTRFPLCGWPLTMWRDILFQWLWRWLFWRHCLFMWPANRIVYCIVSIFTWPSIICVVVACYYLNTVRPMTWYCKCDIVIFVFENDDVTHY